MAKSRFIQPKTIKAGEFTPPDVESLLRVTGAGFTVLEDLVGYLSPEESRLIELMDFDPIYRSTVGLIIEPDTFGMVNKKSRDRGDRWHADFDPRSSTVFVRTKMASFPYGTKYIEHGEIPGLEDASHLPPLALAEFIISNEGQVIIDAAIRDEKVRVEEIRPGEVLECPEMFIHRGPIPSERDGTRAWARSIK